MLHTPLNIKHLRGLKKMNQSELAAELGFRQNTISNYENGKSNPNHGDLVKLSDYFGVGVEVLMRKNLQKEFLTWDEFEIWKKNEQAREDQLGRVSLAPVMLDALMSHYVKRMSQLLNQPADEIRLELEEEFAKSRAAMQGKNIVD